METKYKGMNIEEARALINDEHDSDNGLDTLFRMSSDIEDERIENFIKALKSIEQHYQNQVFIERDLVYKLVGMSKTLRASSGHWKVSRPEGLDSKTCFEIHSAIHDIFTD